MRNVSSYSFHLCRGSLGEGEVNCEWKGARGAMGSGEGREHCFSSLFFHPGVPCALFLSLASELPDYTVKESQKRPMWEKEFLLLVMFQTVEVAAGGALLEEIKPTDMFPGYRLECYPNRDSTAYGELYDITTASTILRGTLRYEVRCT